MLGKESIISKILPRLPLPGPFPIDLPLLLKIGKKVFKYVKEIMSESEINEDSTVRDIETINTALIKLREQVYTDSEQQINDIKCNFDAYAKDIRFFLNEKKEFLDCHNIRYKDLYQALDEIGDSVDSFWKEHINNIFSLDNLECRTMLMIPAGGRKEKELNSFIMRTKLKIIEEFSEYIRDEVNRISNFLLEDIRIAVERVEKKTIQFTKLCADVEDENTVEIERKICEANLKCCMCEKAYSYLEE